MPHSSHHHNISYHVITTARYNATPQPWSCINGCLFTHAIYNNMQWSLPIILCVLQNIHLLNIHLIARTRATENDSRQCVSCGCALLSWSLLANNWTVRSPAQSTIVLLHVCTSHTISFIDLQHPESQRPRKSRLVGLKKQMQQLLWLAVLIVL